MMVKVFFSKRAFITLSLCLFLSASISLADEIYLKSGRKLEGEIISEQGQKVTVKIKGGTITLDKSDIITIEEKALPEEIYRKKLGELKADDAEAHFELALWCKRYGLYEEYEALLEKTLEIDPGHIQAQRVLREYKKSLAIPQISKEAEKRLRKEFPGFKIRRTAHYRICYNTSEDFVQRIAHFLEKVYQQFYRWFEGHGFDVQLTQERLDVILFATADEFSAYIAKTAEIPEDWARRFSGLYIPEENYMIFADATTNPNYKIYKRRLLLLEREIMRLQELAYGPYSPFTVEFPDGHRETLTKNQVLTLIDRERNEVTRLLQKLVRMYNDENIIANAHEATHQLSFNTGLLNRKANVPRWLAEGMAMFFEVSQGGEYLGSRSLNKERLKHFKLAARANYLVPLEEFIAEDMLMGPAPYAQAWALYYFLVNEKATGFADYMKIISGLPENKKFSPEERLKDFRRAFGSDIAGLEEQWMRYMEALARDVK
jgi:hypothetical protein